jgi:hypothetical protein
MSEHDFEPIRGLPGALPAGEELLWQGAPTVWGLATEAFHIRAVGAYFAAMLAWRISGAVSSGAPLGEALLSAASVAPVALAALGILFALALANARTTVYTITSRRVVMRFGAAVPKAVNIPFTRIASAALKVQADGSGDLALKLAKGEHAAFLQFWPHVRPFRVNAPEPTLRGLKDVRLPAGVLTDAMKRVAPVIVLAPKEAQPSPAAADRRSSLRDPPP